MLIFRTLAFRRHLGHEALLHFAAALAHEFEHFAHLGVLVQEFVDFCDGDAGAGGDVEEVPGGGGGIDKYGSTGEESMHLPVLWAILRTLSATLQGEVRLLVRRNEMMQEARLPGIAGAVRSRAHVWRQRAATIAVGSLALVMGYGVVFGHNGLTAFASKRREAKALQLQMQQLQKENERLHGHVDRLQTDPSAIEHEARQQFHYTRPGEVIVTLPVAKPTVIAH